MIPAIVGSRTFNDLTLMRTEVQRAFPDVTSIVSGGAVGADTLARELGTEMNVELIEVLPDWKTYGRGAGPVRNREIVAQSDAVIAFWDGKSKGTASTIALAKKAGKQVIVVRITADSYNTNEAR